MYQVKTLKLSQYFDTPRYHFFSTLLRPVVYTALGLLLLVVWLNTGSSSAFRTDLKQLLLEKLVYSNPPPVGARVDVIYVLGGPPKSLELKYKTAAELYHQGISEKIWILSRPGITEYNPELGRNLANDEWSLAQLEKLGVPEKNVKAIKLKEGFFGTFSEAKGISSLLKDRGYKDIVLITSPDHTFRSKISFDNFLKNQHPSIYVQASGEKASLRTLIVEFIKLKVYQFFLLKNIYL
jgi:uncharacterized SAM-binding protein YcdF (DUF218 family)